MRVSWWNKGLKLLITVSLVMGLVPTPAIAEDAEEVVPAEGVLFAEDDPTVDGDVGEEGQPEPAGGLESAVESEDLTGGDAELVGVTGNSEDTSKANPVPVVDEDEETPKQLLAMSDSPVQIDVGGPYEVSVEEGNYWVGKFVVQQDGIYHFWSEGSYDTCGELYDDENLSNSLISDYDSGDGNNFKKTYSLIAGDIVYLKVYSDGNGELSCNVFVSVTDGFDLSNASISLQSSAIMYTESPIELSETVTDYLGTTLTRNVHYTLVIKEDSTGEIISDFPSGVGSYSVSAVAIEGSGYTGETASIAFNIVAPNDIGSSLWIVGKPGGVVASTGSPLDLGGNLVFNCDTIGDGSWEQVDLEEGTDYEVTAYYGPDGSEVSVSVGAGLYMATIEGRGSYTGSATVSFRVAEPNDIGSFCWSVDSTSIVVVAPTGSPLDLAVDFVFWRDASGDGSWEQVDLEEGTDYEVTAYYGPDGSEVSASVGYGEYSATVEGRGAYTGSVTVGFWIVEPNDIGSATWNVSPYRDVIAPTGSPLNLGSVLVFRRDASGDGSWEEVGLEEGVDYVITAYYGPDGSEVSASVGGGQYSATIEGRGSYGGSISVPFTVQDPNDISSSLWYVTQIYDVLATTGSPIDLGSSLAFFYEGERDLEEGVDYVITAYYGPDGSEVSVSVGAGQYSATIEGRGSYTGSISVPFTVQDPNYLASWRWSVYTTNNLVWTGSAPALSETIAFEFYDDAGWHNRYLVEGTDYVIVGYHDAYGNDIPAPIDEGSYDAVLEGIGSYSGRTYVQFRISDPTNISRDEAHFVSPYSFAYTGSPVALTDIILLHEIADYPYGEEELVEGIDFEITGYRDPEGNDISHPIEPGDYYVVLTGIGQYHGERTLQFSIVDTSDISTANISIINYSFMGDWISGAGGGIYPVFFHEGEIDEVEPRVSAFSAVNGTPLIEGRDYELSYEYNKDNDEPFNVVIVTGINSYHGSQRLLFSVSNSTNIDFYLSYTNPHGGVYIKLGSRTDWYSSHPSYPYTGCAVAPTVLFGSRESNYTPVEGRDFTVSYLDAYGNDIPAPVDVGEYAIQVTPVEGGVLDGSLVIPFSIVWDVDLSSSIYVDSITWADNAERSYLSGGVVYNVVKGPLTEERAQAVSWVELIMDWGWSALVEGVDFLVNYLGVREVIYHPSGVREVVYTHDGVREVVYSHYDVRASVYNKWSVRDCVYYQFSLEGIGSYGGSMLAEVYSASYPDSFDPFTLGSRCASVNGVTYTGSGSLRVNCDEYGNLEEPNVSMRGLVCGVDYSFTGLFNDEGVRVSSASVGDRLNLSIVGLGAYEGHALSIPVRVHRRTREVQDLSTTGLRLANGWGSSDSSGTVWHILRGEEPDVRADVSYGGLVLYDVSSFSVTKNPSADGSSIELTVTDNGSGIVKGTATMTVSVDDQYDLSEFGRPVFFGNGSGNGYDFIDAYYPGTTNPVLLPYAGFSYVPTVTILSPWFHIPLAIIDSPEAPTPTFDVSILDDSGSTVPAITGAGKYVVVLTGSGDWTGTLEVPVLVAPQDVLDVSNCTLVLGEAILSSGLAEPTVTLSYGDHVFSQGSDYTVSYGGNTSFEGGSCFVKVSAVSGGVLSGSKTVSYTVSGDAREKDLSSGDYTLLLMDSMGEGHEGKNGMLCTYCATEGSPAEPEVIVLMRDGLGTTVDPSNYEVTYGNNTSNGVAYVTVTGKGDYSGSLSADYFVVSPRVFEAHAASMPTHIDDTARFVCTVSGISGVSLSYQWQWSRNGGKTWLDSSAAGATTATCSIVATEARVSSQIYRCVVTASDGRVATTEAVGFSVYPDLSASASTSTVSVGEIAQFTCSVEGDAGAKLSYQWQWKDVSETDWNNYTGEHGTDATLSIEASGPITDMLFRCVVISQDGRTAATDPIRFDLALTAWATTERVVLGEEATFRCFVTGAAGADFSYQWQFSRNGGETWINASAAGATTDTYSTQATQSRVDSQLWRCRVTASDGRVATTDAVAFDVVPELTATASTTQVAVGETARFTCEVGGAAGATLTYQWQWSKNGGRTWSNSSAPGATTANCSIAATEARVGAQTYRCIVTSSDGRTATTGAIGFDVALVASASTSPVAIGGTATFTCSVGGAGAAALSYQWQFSRNGGETWINASAAGATTDTYCTQATESRVSSQVWRCYVTADDGRTAITNVIAFDVLPALSATASTSPVAIGQTARFTCSVENAEGAALSYQWQWSRNGGKTWSNSSAAGSQTATCSIAATEARVASQVYRCVVTASDGRTAESDAVGFEVA